MSKPKLDSSIEFGTIITVIICIATVGAMYGSVVSRIDYIDTNGTQMVRSLQSDINKLSTAIVRLETKLEEKERQDANSRRTGAGATEGR